MQWMVFARSRGGVASGRTTMSLTVAVLAVLLLAAGCGGGTKKKAAPTATPVLTPTPIPPVTTLDRSIGFVSTGNPGTLGSYYELEYQEPWDLVVRTDLVPNPPPTPQVRTALSSFVQFTDVHIIDASSPGRFPFLRKLAPLLKSAFHAQDPLTAYVTNAMVEQVNALGKGPITGEPFAFMISTGDNSDSSQVNELKNYVNMFDGKEIIVDSSGEGYIGVQDNYVYTAEGPDRAQSIYGQYWHPDPPPRGIEPDMWKTDYGFPDYPGLLDSVENFTATGLQIPWYSCFGNHDGLLQGNVPLAPFPQLYNFFNDLSSGSEMPLDLPSTMDDIGVLLQCLQNLSNCLPALVEAAPKRTVPANPQRQVLTMYQFVKIHLDSPASPGPVGHGYTEESLATDPPTLYFTFDVGPDILGISLNTVNSGGMDGGYMGTNQLAWLKEQLQAVSSYYYDDSGTKVETGNSDKLVLIFSHHDSQTMSNSIPNPYDPVFVPVGTFIQTLNNYPNVIAWVNGHEHQNAIYAHPDAKGNTQGFWEVNTASHIDMPHQSRTIEITDNHDGTLSIFAIVINDASPPETPDEGPYSPMQLASISRELAWNDWLMQAADSPSPGVLTREALEQGSFVPMEGPPECGRCGQPEDRNVELLLDNPLSD